MHNTILKSIALLELVIAARMSNDDEDKLVEGILEFDRLMAAHEAEEEARQSTYDTQHFLDSDDVNLGLSVDGGAKPKVDSADDAEHGAIELVQLPVPNEKGKSKQLAAWQLIESKRKLDDR